MDKVVLKFLADILYLKGIICWEEFEDIMESKIPSDLDKITDKIIGGDYNIYKRGEGYIKTGNKSRG